MTITDLFRTNCFHQNILATLPWYYGSTNKKCFENCSVYIPCSSKNRCKFRSVYAYIRSIARRHKCCNIYELPVFKSFEFFEKFLPKKYSFSCIWQNSSEFFVLAQYLFGFVLYLTCKFVFIRSS